jgi:hypothetical protein
MGKCARKSSQKWVGEAFSAPGERSLFLRMEIGFSAPGEKKIRKNWASADADTTREGLIIGNEYKK